MTRISMKSAVALTTVMACASTATPAAAQIACGDTITGTAVLTEDLICPNEDPALTVDGGTLVLRGTVSCDVNDATGILLIGEGARLVGGTVTRCLNGIVLEGEGDHRVTGVTSTAHTENGFRIFESNGNRIIRISGLICVLTCAGLITMMLKISGSGPGGVEQLYGTTLLFEGAGGYVLVGVLAFAAAVLITVWGMNSRHKG